MGERNRASGHAVVGVGATAAVLCCVIMGAGCHGRDGEGGPEDSSADAGGTTAPSATTGEGPDGPADRLAVVAAGNTASPGAPTAPGAESGDDCEGFQVVGLTHSPGGDVLPNTCKPFDNFTNNPYAIRCIDADPSFDTGWPGDEFCILPPEPGLGIQIGVHPESYAPGEDTDEFLVVPGGETNQSFTMKAGNDEPFWYYRINYRMRSGSHHMIISKSSEDLPHGWGENVSIVPPGLSGSMGGAQRTVDDRPRHALLVAEENAALGVEMAAKQQIYFSLHHFNATEDDVLREAWVNLWFKPAEEVEEPIEQLFLLGNPLDLNIAPGESRSLHYRCEVRGDARVLSLEGNRHASTSHFSAWGIIGGEHVPLYDSFDYNDAPSYGYDSQTDNPIADVDRKIDGAHSGALRFTAGDELHFRCDVHNQTDRALRFANEVFTGEMCIQFGDVTGTGFDGCSFGYGGLPLLNQRD